MLVLDGFSYFGFGLDEMELCNNNFTSDEKKLRGGFEGVLRVLQ